MSRLCILLFSLFALAQASADEVQAVVSNNLESAPENKESPVSERVIYTIKGRKDPRLKATFLASYVSTSRSEACSHKQTTTASRKVKIADTAYPVADENYLIQIPISLEENATECGYRFSRIELVLRRLYDNELYSRHIILDRTSKVHAIYRGTKTGMSGGGSDKRMPSSLEVDKRYFRIAKKTQYLCNTTYYENRMGSSLECFMRLRDGEGGNQFIYPTQWMWATHPELGVDKIESDVLQVDIIADDNNSKLANGKEVLPDYFRTLPKPDPTLWQKTAKKINDFVNTIYRYLDFETVLVVVLIPLLAIIVIGFIEVPYSFFKANYDEGYRVAASFTWFMTIGSLLLSVASANVTVLTFLLIPSFFGICYIYLLSKSMQKEKCSDNRRAVSLSDVNAAVEINDIHTDLIEAVVNNNLDLVETLVSRGANPKVKNKSGYSAEDFARGHGYKHICKYFLKHAQNSNIVISEEKRNLK